MSRYLLLGEVTYYLHVMHSNLDILLLALEILCFKGITIVCCN